MELSNIIWGFKYNVGNPDVIEGFIIITSFFSDKF